MHKKISKLNQNTYRQVSLNTDNEDDIEMDDQTKNVINNNIQPKSNMEFKEQQSSDTNLNLIISDEPKNKKKKIKKNER